MRIPVLLASLATRAACSDAGPGTAVLVRLRAGTDSLLGALAPEERTRGGVRAALAAHVLTSQKEVAQLLDEGGAEYRSFWIDNVLAVEKLSAPLHRALLAHPDVVSVEEDGYVQLPKLQHRGSESPQVSTQPQSNIAELHTAELWKHGFRGQGAVVATIDSGVRWTHEALRSNYRGFAEGKAEADHDYAFWTPDSQKLTPESADLFGHGSHVMGTLAGAGPYGIGMAPNATWITAKAFNWDGDAKKSDILAAAQWVLCPTKYDHSQEDCSKGANIVSCSFGGNSSTTWLNPAVKAMRAAGVLPVFSAGNVNAAKCSTVLEPAGCEEAIAVGGADTKLKNLYRQSGKGPGMGGAIKPDFVAPYLGIRSVCSGADSGHSGYMELTGTSMSAPHVSGALALLWSIQAEHAKADDLVAALKETTFRSFKRPLLTPGTCGGTRYDQYPNNDYGWGFPDVCAAAAKLGAPCQAAGGQEEVVV